MSGRSGGVRGAKGRCVGARALATFKFPMATSIEPMPLKSSSSIRWRVMMMSWPMLWSWRPSNIKENIDLKAHKKLSQGMSGQRSWPKMSNKMAHHLQIGARVRKGDGDHARADNASMGDGKFGGHPHATHTTMVLPPVVIGISVIGSEAISLCARGQAKRGVGTVRSNVGLAAASGRKQRTSDERDNAMCA